MPRLQVILLAILLMLCLPSTGVVVSAGTSRGGGGEEQVLASTYFHFQDLLFGPTTKEIRAFCLHAVRIFEVDATTAAVADSKINMNPTSASQEDFLTTNATEQNQTLPSSDGRSSTPTTATKAMSSSFSFSDAERANLLSNCEKAATNYIFEAMGGSRGEYSSIDEAVSSPSSGAQQAPNTRAPSPPPAPHGTLLFRVLPGLFWKGSGFDDAEISINSTTNISNSEGQKGRKDPILVLSTQPTNALTMVTTANISGGSGGSSSVAPSPTLQNETQKVGLWSLSLWQWRFFNGLNTTRLTTALASVASPLFIQSSSASASPTTGSASILPSSSSLSPSMAALSSFFNESSQAASNPAKHQLGGSLAVLCDPVGFANTFGANATGGERSSMTAVPTLSEYATVVSMNNFSALCALGDYRPADNNLSSVVNASTSSSQPSTVLNSSSFPFNYPSAVGTSASVNTSRMFRWLLKSFYRERLRGSVFALSWDRSVTVEAFGHVGIADDESDGDSGNTNAAPLPSFFNFGAQQDSVRCPLPSKSINGGIEVAPGDLVPSFVVPLSTSDDSGSQAQTTSSSTGGNGVGPSGSVDMPTTPWWTVSAADAINKNTNGLGVSLSVRKDSQTISNVYQRDFGDGYHVKSVTGDCRRVAIRVPAIVALDGSMLTPSVNEGKLVFSGKAGGGLGMDSNGLSKIAAVSADIVVADTVVACEPLLGTYTVSSTMRPTDGASRDPSPANFTLSLLRPAKTLRMSERTAAASSLSFASWDTAEQQELTSSPQPEGENGDNTGDQPPSPSNEGWGWDTSQANTPQSIFAYNYVLGDPLAYAEISPVRKAQKRLMVERSAGQLGTRIVVEEGPPMSASPATSSPNTAGRLRLNHTRSAPVVGIIGLSPAPACQPTSAVIAYHPLSGALAVSRNTSDLANFLAENLKVFGQDGRFGYRLDLISNFGAPMSTHDNPLSPTGFADGMNEPNIAWFDVIPPFTAAVGVMGSDPSRATDSPHASLLASSQYPFPILAATAIGTCPSGRRIISEIRTVPKGDHLTSSVTVVVGAPIFAPLIISRALMYGMKAWTNLTCYEPSSTNAADVDAMGGPAAFSLAKNVNAWSSHPLSGLSVDSLTFVYCYSRDRPFGVADSDSPPTSSGKERDDRFPSSPPLSSYLPSFTLYPDAGAGGGVYPQKPSVFEGSTSTAFASSTEARGLKVRLSRLARFHSRHGSVVPLYVADISQEEAAGGLGNIVVLGSAALVDFLVISDSNSGRIGFAPALSSKAMADAARLTTRFTVWSAPDAEALATSTSSADPYGSIPAAYSASPRTLSDVPEGSGTSLSTSYPSFFYPAADPFDSDGPADCALPVVCEGDLIHIKALNICVDPVCGSWLSTFNDDSYTCEYRPLIIVVMALAAAAAVALEMVLHWLISRQLDLVDRQQTRMLAKKLS